MVPIRIGVKEGAGFGQKSDRAGMFHFVTPQGAQGSRLIRIFFVDGGGELPDMFAGVVEVEDFNSIREGEAGVFPNPRRTIANEDDPFGMVESAPPSFLMEQNGDLAASLVSTLQNRRKNYFAVHEPPTHPNQSIRTREI